MRTGSRDVFLEPDTAHALRAIHRASRELSRSMPILSVFMSKESASGLGRTECVAVPNYSFPEEAARALSLVARYRAWRLLPEEPPEVLSASIMIARPP